MKPAIYTIARQKMLVLEDHESLCVFGMARVGKDNTKNYVALPLYANRREVHQAWTCKKLKWNSPTGRGLTSLADNMGFDNTSRKPTKIDQCDLENQIDHLADRNHWLVGDQCPSLSPTKYAWERDDAPKPCYWLCVGRTAIAYRPLQWTNARPIAFRCTMPTIGPDFDLLLDLADRAALNIPDHYPVIKLSYKLIDSVVRSQVFGHNGPAGARVITHNQQAPAIDTNKRRSWKPSWKPAEAT